mgnify:CR=1 FL=1
MHAQDLEEDDNSILNVYRNLASLHREDSAFHYGDIELADCEDADIFAFVRYYDGTDRYNTVFKYFSSYIQSQ